MLNLVKYRYFFIALSLVIIVPGIISLLVFGLQVGIDFKGGSIWDLNFPKPTVALTTDGVTNTVKNAVKNDPAYQTMVVQMRDNNKGETGQSVVIRTPELVAGSAAKDTIKKALTDKYGQGTEVSFNSIGPTIGGEVTLRSALAVLFASLGILAYITYAFRRVKRPLRYGACAIMAMLHDVLVVIGIFSILGAVFNTQVDALFVTALLTVIGFSVHDTIVVFDRIRENAIKAPGEDFESVVNHSLVQTLARSLTTSLTVIFTLLALYLFGGITIRDFVLALLIGIISGTYSSIFNASMLLVIWEKHEYRNWFRRRPVASIA